MLHNQISIIPIILQKNNTISLSTGKLCTSIFLRQGCDPPVDLFKHNFIIFQKKSNRRHYKPALTWYSENGTGNSHNPRKGRSEEE